VETTFAAQLPPAGLGVAGKLKDPAEPHPLPETGVHAPDAARVTVAHAEPWHAWSPWKTPVGAHTWPDPLHEQVHDAGGACKPPWVSTRLS
jgi:hypothetical protein